MGLKPDSVLAAFGFFDDDKYCDIVVLNTAMTEVNIYLWDTTDLEFKLEKGFTLKPKEKILSVIPGDYNYDGALDLLITLESGKIEIHK
jgi:integrin alpha FG-GAP repeat containing protein 1